MPRDNVYVEEPRNTSMCLILINGQQGQYIHWAMQDFDGLGARLPEIHEGAGKWIQIFEQKTAGCVSAIGDIMALLAKCVGGTKLNELLNDAGLRIAIDNIRRDKMTFAPFRKSTWTTIHREYPMQIDPKMLRGDPFGETENPTAYVQKQLKRWREELEKDPEEDFVLAALFRKAILEAMPPPVETKLKDVVELNSKSHKEFCDHVSHAVEQHLKNELKATTAEREREMQRGLPQLQRDDFVSKTTKKAQAVLKEEQPALKALINKLAPHHPANTDRSTSPTHSGKCSTASQSHCYLCKAKTAKQQEWTKNSEEAEDKAEQKDHVIDAGTVKMLGLELKIFARTRRDPSGPDGLGRVLASFLTFYTGSGRARACTPAL
ncbi:uncharacterized protein [Misgurnus anguillicaudatus]|uniref:uncharacterized protein n=1 Tax=Misgurnus anguillicaudatus TaxID=75329 RepID=UPI003CCF995B